MGADGIAPSGALLALAFLLVGLMGFAIQRGTTCLVAAMDEIVTRRSAHRLRAILLAGLLAGAVTGLLMPDRSTGPDVPPLAFTLVGAGLLGVGAVVNRACVVGTVARIGAGEWAFLFTPVGIFAASLLIADSPLLPLETRRAETAPCAGAVSAMVFGALLLPLLAGKLRAGTGGKGAVRSSIRSPHAATVGIGLLFAALALLASPWSYADALAHLARTGMADRPALHLALIATLLGCARLGGLGRPQPRQRLADCLCCFAGGAVMALGAALVPGSNDSLLLDGAPRLQAHALLALAAMAATIAVGLQVRRRFRLRQ